MKTFTPITLFAFGVITLIIGGALGYTAGYDQGFERSHRNTPPQNFELPDQTPPPSTTTSSPILTSPTPTPRPTPPAPSRPAPSKGACVPAGCSSQLCVDADEASGTVSTCEFRDIYACYRTARCERQTTGDCGWTQTAALKACLQNPPPLE